MHVCAQDIYILRQQHCASNCVNIYTTLNQMNIFFSMSTPLCVPRLIGATRLSNGLKRRLWLHVAINWRTILCRADEYSPLVPRSIHEKFCRGSLPLRIFPRSPCPSPSRCSFPQNPHWFPALPTITNSRPHRSGRLRQTEEGCGGGRGLDIVHACLMYAIGRWWGGGGASGVILLPPLSYSTRLPVPCASPSPFVLTSATLGIWDVQEYYKAEENEQEAEVVESASGSRVGLSHASWCRWL